VFVWSNPHSPTDGAFLAGLITGDGSFGIRPNNSGASWACQLRINLRDDDTPLLASVCRWCKAGRLHTVSARNTSHPQTLWLVQRQTDCLRLLQILERHPPIGKKALQFEIWRRAVLAWTSGQPGPGDVLARCAELLSASRHPEHSPLGSGVDITTPYLLAFLAGFATAEAHFGAVPGDRPAFVINQRRDDGGILRLLHERLEIGHIAEVPARGASRAALSWRIGKLADLRALVAALDRYPPRGRVLRIYRAWRELVLIEPQRRGARHQLADEVRRRRAYKPGLGTILPTDARRARQIHHLEALRAWSAAYGGPFTTTAYDAWRRRRAPECPGRNTIAAAFGSWLNALAAAGLSAEGCRPADRNAKTTRAQADVRRERRERQITAVLDGVERCTQALGHTPCATEFFAWRRCEPGVPSQMTVYRLFNGGWPAVLTAHAHHLK
jgi:hypothetical protein